jgi:hypothetical protein
MPEINDAVEAILDINPAEPDTSAPNTATPMDESEARMQRFRDAVFKGKSKDIEESFKERADEILARNTQITDKYCVITILEPSSKIIEVDLDWVFLSLRRRNSDRAKDVLLVLLSQGGEIEPAYQISKVCKEQSANRFITAIPRRAKSAATLIALGSDEIHMGPLGQLGPIDPQLGTLPALAVSKALETIAGVCQQFPGSALMFARYLKDSLTVREIGYCDRIAESAVQYAERLLSTKPSIGVRAGDIAKKLVHEFKDHGFVIDRAEATGILGKEVVKINTSEIEFAEQIYDLYEEFNWWLRRRKKEIIVCGDWDDRVIVRNTEHD